MENPIIDLKISCDSNPRIVEWLKDNNKSYEIIKTGNSPYYLLIHPVSVEEQKEIRKHVHKFIKQ